MTTVVIIFVLVYLGMLLGELPFLQIDRTGVALLGVIALVVSQSITLSEAGRALHIPTLILLFSFMVISAQMQLGGFYTWVTDRLGTLSVTPPGLLAILIVLVAALSAVFSNDIVCLAIAPVLIDICRRRRYNSVPFLLALACAANIGSATTLIGNPQNILIGSRLRLSFTGYLSLASVPVGLGLIIVWAIIYLLWRQRWMSASESDPVRPETTRRTYAVDRWQSVKGLVVAGALFALFLWGDAPHEVSALGGAGFLLLSRKLHSRDMLGLVDWSVLILFIGLFIVNEAFQQTGIAQQLVADLAKRGINLQHPMTLYLLTALLSNVVSNVPAIMLLLPTASPQDGVPLALASTFSGNFILVGSIANMIVVDAANKRGIAISGRQHAMVGIPVTLLTLGLTAVYLQFIAHG